jgi:hypothetical protein
MSAITHPNAPASESSGPGFDAQAESPSPLAVIEVFLRHFGPEVTGREGGVVTPQLREMLERLTRGELDEASRRDVARELLTNPQAMDLLVRHTMDWEQRRRGLAGS